MIPDANFFRETNYAKLHEAPKQDSNYRTIMIITFISNARARARYGGKVILKLIFNLVKLRVRRAENFAGI